MAQKLYEKQGFKPVAWFDFIFDDVDEQGKPYNHRTRWPYMSNHFVGHEKEIEQAQKRQSYNGPAELDPELAN